MFLSKNFFPSASVVNLLLSWLSAGAILRAPLRSLWLMFPPLTSPQSRGTKEVGSSSAPLVSNGDASGDETS